MGETCTYSFVLCNKKCDMSAVLAGPQNIFIYPASRREGRRFSLKLQLMINNMHEFPALQQIFH
jgi:hypothetical protein